MKKIIKLIKRNERIFIVLAILTLFIASAGTSIYFFSHKDNPDSSSNQDNSNPKQTIGYEYIKTHYKAAGSAPRFIYYTAETDDKKLIKINDKVIASLKKDQKITKDTKEYYIDYFKDKESINIYYDQSAKAELSNIQRMSLTSKLVAQMIYIEKNNKSLVDLLAGKVLKKY